MLRRDATPELKSPREVVSLSEAERNALSTTEVDELIQHFQRNAVVRKKKLHQRCIDRRCRRFRTCTSGNKACLCADVPRMSKRESDRMGLHRPRRRFRI
jgi:hypothetical protein